MFTNYTDSPFAPVEFDIASQSLTPEPFPGYMESGAIAGKLERVALSTTPGMRPHSPALDLGPTFTIYIDGTAKYRLPFGAVVDSDARRELGPHLAEALVNGERERVQERLHAHFATQHGIRPDRVAVVFSPRLS